jgi:hypothetical protein
VKVTAPPIKHGSSALSEFYHSIFGFLASYRVSKYKKLWEITDEIKKIKENGQDSRKSLENGLYHSLYNVCTSQKFSVFTSNRPARLMLASSRVCFFKFLLIYSKPCLVQLPRPYSFQKIS